MRANKNHLSQEEFKKIIWDYTIAPDVFSDILSGKKTVGWFTQEWAIARVLENLGYYRAMDLVGHATLSKKWNGVKGKIYDASLRRGYEYALRRHTLPPAR